MEAEELELFRKAGKIASKVREASKSLIMVGASLLDIAETTEQMVKEEGARPAFPVNISINDIAAHYTPSNDDKTTAEGLLKIDIGIHINGAIADTAFSIDLSNIEENRKLIEASEQALEEAIKTIREGIELWKIGEVIQKKIESYKFSPIRNLCGHSLAEYEIHAGTTIPNCNNSSSNILKEGAYAIEPFATPGHGIIYDGKPSGIFKFEERKAIRDPIARKILDLIEQEYKTLPFCSRWIVNKFGPRSLLALHLLEQAGILNQYPQLIEKSHSKVAQSEHTVILKNNQVEVIT